MTHQEGDSFMLPVLLMLIVVMLLVPLCPSSHFLTRSHLVMEDFDVSDKCFPGGGELCIGGCELGVVCYEF